MSDRTDGFRFLRTRDVVLVILMVVLPLAALPFLPDPIPIHWNLHGEADRWTSRWPGVLLFLLIPGSMALLWLLLSTVARWSGGESDDLGAVRIAFGRLRTGVLLLMLLVEATALGEVAGWPVSTGRTSLVLMGFGFSGLGPLMHELPRNPWLGVRTPWTLDDDRVWERTHRFTARLFVPGGLLVAAAALLPAPFHVVTGLGLLAGVGLVPVAYAYRIRSRG